MENELKKGAKPRKNPAEPRKSGPKKQPLKHVMIGGKGVFFFKQWIPLHGDAEKHAALMANDVEAARLADDVEAALRKRGDAATGPDGLTYRIAFAGLYEAPKGSGLENGIGEIHVYHTGPGWPTQLAKQGGEPMTDGRRLYVVHLAKDMRLDDALEMVARDAAPTKEKATRMFAGADKHPNSIGSHPDVLKTVVGMTVHPGEVVKHEKIWAYRMKGPKQIRAIAFSERKEVDGPKGAAVIGKDDILKRVKEWNEDATLIKFMAWLHSEAEAGGRKAGSWQTGKVSISQMANNIVGRTDARAMKQVYNAMMKLASAQMWCTNGLHGPKRESVYVPVIMVKKYGEARPKYEITLLPGIWGSNSAAIFLPKAILAIDGRQESAIRLAAYLAMRLFEHNNDARDVAVTLALADMMAGAGISRDRKNKRTARTEIQAAMEELVSKGIFEATDIGDSWQVNKGKVYKQLR